MMQLRKPIAPRACVDNQAVEAIQKLAVSKVTDLVKRAKIRKLPQQDRILLAKIYPLARGETAAVERLRSDLLGLSFQAISRSDRFIHCATKPVLVTEISTSYSNRRGAPPQEELTFVREKYDIGEYDVYIDLRIFLGLGMDENMYFIPRRDPLARYRHWHHILYPAGQRWVSREDDRAEHPFDGVSHTCMSSYAGILNDLVNNFAVAEFLRMTHIFLSNYYAGSPLCFPDETIVKVLK